MQFLDLARHHIDNHKALSTTIHAYGKGRDGYGQLYGFEGLGPCFETVDEYRYITLIPVNSTYRGTLDSGNPSNVEKEYEATVNNAGTLFDIAKGNDMVHVDLGNPEVGIVAGSQDTIFTVVFFRENEYLDACNELIDYMNS